MSSDRSEWPTFRVTLKHVRRDTKHEVTLAAPNQWEAGHKALEVWIGDLYRKGTPIGSEYEIVIDDVIRVDP